MPTLRMLQQASILILSLHSFSESSSVARSGDYGGAACSGNACGGGDNGSGDHSGCAQCKGKSRTHLLSRVDSEDGFMNMIAG